MNKHYKNLELDKIIEIVKAHCSFSLGKEMINDMQVDYNPLVIKRNINESNEALAITISYGKLPFNGAKDINLELNQAKKGQTLMAHQLLAVNDVNNTAKFIKRFVTKEVDLKTPLISGYVDTLVFFESFDNKIKHTINNYGEIMDSASPTLGHLKSELNAVERNITSSINRFIKDNGDVLQESSVYFRQNRSCVLIKSTSKNSFNGLIHGDSASKQASYVEPGFLVPLNNKKQNIENEIEIEIKRILKELSNDVMELADIMLANLETIAYLDAVFAKAEYGKANEGIIGTISNDGQLYLKNARHPLINKDVVVSNTYQLDKNKSCLLITGSNTGGKTVSLKIFGLFVLMTYLGIPVLAQEVEIPLFDAVYEDISDGQSIIESLSTFSSHLKKLSYITNHVTSKSLVLLDELGSGTDPKDGEALAIAILDYLRSKHAMIVCTTHYSKLKTYGQKHHDILLGSVMFDKEKLIPTYKFVEGMVGESNAFNIATKFDFNPIIINNAINLKESSITEDERLIDELRNQIIEQHQLKDDYINKLKEIEQQELAYQKQLNDLEHKKEMMLNQAMEEAKAYKLEKMAEIELLIDELKNSNLKYHEALKVKKAVEDLVDEIDEEDENSNDDLVVGDHVRMKSSNQVGELIQINKKQAIVLINGIKMTVKLKDLTKTVKVAKVKPPRSSKREFKIHTMSNECLLIGLNSEEAYEVMTKYIDDAMVNNLKYFRIIHGHGQGILRKMVHNYLKNNSNVKSYSLAMAHEGGQGATIVELK